MEAQTEAAGRGLSVARAIVAHTTRSNMAHALSAQLDDARIFLDDGTLGEQANHTRALAWLADQDTDWVTLHEDDALPCPDYLTREAGAIRRAPTRHVLSHYLGTGRWAGRDPRRHTHHVQSLIQRADHTGSEWITTSELWHAVTISLPITAARDALPHLGSLPTDQALTRWARRAGWRIAYAWPSLVDHHDGPTVTQHVDRQPRTQPRKAWRLAGT